MVTFMATGGATSDIWPERDVSPECREAIDRAAIRVLRMFGPDGTHRHLVEPRRPEGYISPKRTKSNE